MDGEFARGMKFFGGVVVGAGVFGLGFLAVRAYRRRAAEQAEAESRALALARLDSMIRNKIDAAKASGEMWPLR